MGDDKWIDASERLPEPKKKYEFESRLQECLVVVCELVYFDPDGWLEVLETPEEHEYIGIATYDADQKIWNLMNGDSISATIEPAPDRRSVIYWMPLPEIPAEN